MDLIGLLGGFLNIVRIFLSITLSFLVTFLLMHFLPLGKVLLGTDRGRLYAVGSEVNIGKPTGVGVYFVSVFAVMSVLFYGFGAGYFFSVDMIILCMIFGFLDDRSKQPWGEYVKGAIDAGAALLGSIIFVVAYGSEFVTGLTGTWNYINPFLYILLATVLFIVSINATNATDGVDGLSGTLTILSVITFMIAAAINGTLSVQGAIPGLVMISVLIAYLFFNFNPSKVLMGDAGSRAIGYFIAFYAMYLKIPFAYLIVCLPFLIDGGLSILKITIGRLTKKKVIILPKLITPVHDHLKKKLGFSVKKTWAVISGAALVIDVIYLLWAAVLH